MIDPEELAETLLPWALPVVIVLAVGGIAVLCTVWIVRRLRNGPRARSRAEARLRRAGDALVELDERVADLDLEVGLTGAVGDEDAPRALRSARMTAQHSREEAFDLYLAAIDGEIPPTDTMAAARRLEELIADGKEAVEQAREEHAAWLEDRVSARDRIGMARERIAQVRARIGDPGALIRELEERADAEEWSHAATAAEDARAAIEEAERAVAAVDTDAASLNELIVSEAALRRADTRMRAVEELHRLVLQATHAVPDEIAALRASLRAAAGIGAALYGEDSERVTEAINRGEREIRRIERDDARRPLSANEAIAAAHAALDEALGDSRTQQQRQRAARAALAGTLAAARTAMARAEATFPARGAGIEARGMLESARRALASARQLHDPVAGLAAARRAAQHAEGAVTLVSHEGHGA